MSAGLNRAYLVGHVGHDGELRTSISGGKLAVLSIATVASRTVDGDAVEVVDWHRVTAHGPIADVLAAARKGQTIAVECAIRSSKWSDRNGTIHYDVALVVERVVSLGGGAK